jgi:peptide/nickel transport system substrate-binding protein
MQQWVSWEICQKANGWQLQNKCRWSSPEYDKAFRAAEIELDPVKRAALFVQMNDMACNAGHVVPVALRAQVTALSKSVSAPLTGWDLDLSGIHDWFRA